MLAERIAFLLNNQEMREAMSESNKKLVRQLSAELVTQEYLQAFRTVIDRR